MMWAVYSLFIRNYVYVLTNVITSASAVLFLLREPKARRNNRMKVRVRRVSAEDVPVAITTEFIKLESFLKLANAVPSGGMAEKLHPERRGTRQRRAVHHAAAKSSAPRRRPV